MTPARGLPSAGQVLLVALSPTIVHYTYLLAYAKGLKSLGYVPVLLVSAAYRPLANSEFEHLYVSDALRYRSRWHELVSFLFSTKRWWSELRTRRPQAAFLFVTSPLNPWLCLLGRLALNTCRFSLYLHEPASVRRKMRRGLGLAWAISVTVVQRIETAMVHHVFVSTERVSGIAASEFSIPREKVSIAPILIHDEARSGLKKKGSVLFAGRAGAERGIDTFLEVVSRELASPGDTNFMIATRDDISERLSARGLLANERLEFSTGRQLSDREMASFFDRAEAVVLLYREEVMQSGIPPMAYMHGCALIATNRPGVAEEVEHGRTGWLIGAEPDADALVDAIRQVRSRISEMGPLARQRYETHHSAAAIHLYRDMFA